MQPSNRYLRCVLLLILLSPVIAYGQKDSLQLKKALDLKANRMFSESLVLFRQLLYTDSSNVVYLSNTAFLMARQGIHMATPEQRMKAYRQARYLAEKAISIAPKYGEAHLSLAIALGRESEASSTSVKIENAKRIRKEAELAIALDPTLAGPYHILGKWHQIVAGFNGFEKAVIAAFFGPGLDGGTYEDAIRNFKIAIKLEPENVNHYLQLAITYLERDQNGDVAIAKKILKQIQDIPTPAHDDQIIKKMAAQRLNEL